MQICFWEFSETSLVESQALFIDQLIGMWPSRNHVLSSSVLLFIVRCLLLTRSPDRGRPTTTFLKSSSKFRTVPFSAAGSINPPLRCSHSSFHHNQSSQLASELTPSLQIRFSSQAFRDQRFVTCSPCKTSAGDAKGKPFF